MKTIIGIDQLDEFILDNNDKIILLYFGAIWCGPCKVLKDRLNNSETKIELPNLCVGYIDIDNDENNEIVTLYNVTILPTQIFVKLSKNSVKIIDQIVGYDWTKLLMIYNKIEK